MNRPLADRIRPQTLDEISGQKHLIGKNMPLRNIIESGKIPNMIFTDRRVLENHTCLNYCQAYKYDTSQAEWYYCIDGGYKGYCF